jgi:hypothetical protein
LRSTVAGTAESGKADDIIARPDPLADSIPGAILVKVPGDHITALLQPQFKQAILDFFALHSPVPV